MRCYENFDACTQRALQFALKTFEVELSAAQQQLLADCLNLPAFPDVLSALESLQASGYRLLAFSNGVESSLRTLLDSAGVLRYLAGIVSVDAIKTFKPSPDVYACLVRKGAVAVKTRGSSPPLVDATSITYLNGCRVDYVETLEGAGFKFENPNVKSTCGCGSSFNV